jgi:hypothetical protein
VGLAIAIMAQLVHELVRSNAYSTAERELATGKDLDGAHAGIGNPVETTGWLVTKVGADGPVWRTAKAHNDIVQGAFEIRGQTRLFLLTKQVIHAHHQQALGGARGVTAAKW